VKLDEPLVEIETDKAVVEVPAPIAGTLVSQGGSPGDTLHVGDLLAVLDAGARSAEARPSAKAAATAVAALLPVGDGHVAAAPPQRRPLATPSVRKLARELDVDLSTVNPSGPGGRISAEDVQSASQVESAPVAQAIPSAAPVSVPDRSVTPPSAPPGVLPEDERVPLRGLRKRIAESMALSWRTIPHITGMDEIDASQLMSLRERLRPSFDQQGIHLSYLPVIVQAAVAALRQHPAVNASLDEQAGEIVYHHRYNIGIATATPEGLIVPVIHDADKKTLRSLASEIRDLTEQARQRTIPLSALQGGTFTITNFGSLGGWLGTPIIRPGEAGILGIGRIQDRPWVVDGRLEVRPVLALSFAADHRLIDGDVSTAFMRTLAGYLVEPLTLFAELI
jgi:pyruvate dehydrogenase E2 component (dihydrolipoamide acetyltransferase)